jgi:hypothetical protein
MINAVLVICVIAQRIIANALIDCSARLTG